MKRNSKSRFVGKLWIFVNDPKLDDLIAWTDSGDSFIIKDATRFANELLPQYFNHKNMASFIRQLNNYGFKKVIDDGKSGLENKSDEVEFKHEFDYFKADGEELLELIVLKVPDRKPKVPKAPSNSNEQDNLRHLTFTQERQENMYSKTLKMNDLEMLSKEFIGMKQKLKEQEMLLQEFIAMKQKLKEQEMVIEMIAHFLIPKMQKGALKKITRRMHDNPNTSSSQVSRATDVIQNKNPECVGSLLAPVRHEITDNVPAVANRHLVSILKSPAMIHVTESPASQEENDDSSQCKHAFIKSSSKQITLHKQASTNLNAPVEQLRILEALLQRSPAANRDEINQNESILGIPLDYISDLGSTELVNIISIPEDGTMCNVLSIPEDGTVSNVISVPENNDIGNVISLPEDNTISDTIPISTISNVTDKEVTTRNPASPLANPIESIFTIPELFNLSAFAVLSELPPSTSNENNSKSLQLAVSENDFDDSLLSESLQTPKIIINSDEDVCHSSREVDTELIKKGEISEASTPESSNLVKNVLTNHLSSVNEELNYALDQLTPCDFDVYNLRRDGEHLKDEKNKIKGSEIVPLSLNIQNLDFFLSEKKRYEEMISRGLNDQSEFLLDVLKETPETANFITNQASTDNTSSKRKKRTPITPKKKRYKGGIKPKDFI